MTSGRQRYNLLNVALAYCPLEGRTRNVHICRAFKSQRYAKTSHAR